MPNTQPTFNVGDIVICSRRRQGLIYKVTEIITETYTQQHVQWNHCTQAQVGTSYPIELKLQSIFDLTLFPRAKERKVGFRSPLWRCSKVEPQQVVELMQRLDRFIVDTWP